MIAVIACGNLNRSDDAAASAVLLGLLRHKDLQERPDLRLFNAASDGLAVMFQARGCEQLHIIDACSSGQAPGSIFELPGEEFISRREPPRDSHALRWDDALTIGQQLYRDDFPSIIKIYLIEAQNLNLGLDLSPAVKQAVEVLTERLAARLVVAREPA